MRQIFLTSILVLVSLIINAQNFSITEQRAKTEEGQEADAWAAHIDQPIDFAKKTFTKFIKTNFDIKIDDKGKTILFVEKTRFADISSLRGDLRAIYSPEGTGCTVSFVFSPGYDIHLNKVNFPQEFAKMQALVKKYVKFHYTEHFQEFIKETEGKIKDKRDEIAKNEKRIESLKKDIAENEQEINAGNKKSDKLRERNIKYNADIVNAQTKINDANAEIVKLQDLINKSNEALKKVYEFQ